MMGAIGQTRDGSRAAKSEFRLRRIAHRPAAHGFAQIHDGDALRHGTTTSSSRIGRSGSGSACSCVGTGASTTLLRGAGARRWSAWCAGGLARTLGRAGCLRLATARESQAMHFADDGVTRHVADLSRDLACAQAIRPELLEELHPLVRPRHARICHQSASIGAAAPESLMRRGQRYVRPRSLGRS